jgi:hypothetical protein
MDAADYRVNLQVIREAVRLILQRGAGEGHEDAGGRKPYNENRVRLALKLCHNL